MDYIPVLVVDDDKILLDDITSMYDWQGGGFQVVATAVNGVQALTLFRQFHPQLVITDIVMPGMNGIDLLRDLAIERIDFAAGEVVGRVRGGEPIPMRLELREGLIVVHTL